MKWTRHGEFGMVSDPYRVGKYFLDGCTLYGLWFNQELIGYFKDFKECQYRKTTFDERCKGCTCP